MSEPKKIMQDASTGEAIAAPMDEHDLALMDAQAAEYEAKAVQRKINQLEATITPRRMREAILGADGGWLAQTENSISALRKQLT